MSDDLEQRLWDFQPAIEESIRADLERKAYVGEHTANVSPLIVGTPRTPSQRLAHDATGFEATTGHEVTDGYEDAHVYSGGGSGGSTSRRTLLFAAAASVTILGGVGWALVDRDRERSRTTASPETTAGTSTTDVATDPAQTSATPTSATTATATTATPTAPATDAPTVPPTDPATAPPTDPATAPPTDPATAPPSTVVENVIAASPPVPLTRNLKEGSSGADVTLLQQRLTDLRLQTGGTSGSFNHLTTQAVWAFQKLVMQIPPSKANGIVTPDVWTAMQGAVTLAARKPSSTAAHVEVYVPEQVLVVFKAGVPVLMSHISTGSGKSWKAAIVLDPGTPDNPGATPLTQHILGSSITPGGSYKFVWRYTTGDGWRTGKLGKMYKPMYFNQGVAVHGMTDVPGYPASHGCVRLPMGATDGNNEPKGPNPADMFPTLVSNGDQIFVFTDTNPTAQGNEAPPYDKPDPAFATTTTAAPAATPPPATSPASAPVTAPAMVPPAVAPTTPAAATSTTSVVTTPPAT